MGWAWWESGQLAGAAELERERGDLDAAEGHALRCLELSLSLGDRRRAVLTAAKLAVIAAERGDAERAGRLWGAIESEQTSRPVRQWENDREELEALVLGADGPAFARRAHGGPSAVNRRGGRPRPALVVRAEPDDLETGALMGAVADGWGFDVEEAEYAAVGAGSYHWEVSDRDGERRFLTVDDLDQKSWLGDTRESAYEGLERAFATAVGLRNAGLAFVVAPIPTSLGDALRRIGPRHTLALFPFVDGQAGQYGHYDAGMRGALLSMLAELHLATPEVASVARSIGLELPGRRHLHAALQELNQTWSGGPFSEPARQMVAAHASDVAELISLADRLAAEVEQRGSTWVVTHGEPHSANVMRVGSSHLLVDWDTVGLASRERDLWMLIDDGTEDLAVYTDATGHHVDLDAVDFFRLTWDLKDLAEYLNVLRAPHLENEDTVRAYEGVTNCVTSRDQWAALLG